MEARRRAIGEVVKLKLHNGQPIIDPRTGELYLEHAYSDKLLALLLKGADPAKYGNRASSNNAAPEPRGKVVIVLPDNGRGSLDGLETITESELSRRRSELDDRPR